MMGASIVRPVSGKLRIELPYQPAGANYDLLKRVCGERTRPKWAGRYFVVARQHLAKLIERLPNELGTDVKLIMHGATQTLCVSACWAANPATYWECVCSCAGTNHGTGVPFSKQVSSDLSVETQYTTNTRWLRPTAP